MAGRVLGRVGVVEIGHLLVPLRGPRSAQVRPRHEGAVASHLDLGLEDVGEVGLPLLLARRARGGSRGTPRPSASRAGCARRDPSRGDQPLDDVELEAAGIRDVVHHRIGRTRERHRDQSPRAAAAARRRRACRPRPRSPPARSRPSARSRSRARASFGTRKLRPIEDGKKPFLAALRSSFDSSARPADSGISLPCRRPRRRRCFFSGGVPDGIRKPVRYQFEGRTQPGSRSSASACPGQGPTRSSFSASTSRARTSRDAAVRLVHEVASCANRSGFQIVSASRW